MIDSLTLQHHIGPFLGEVFMGIVNCIFTVLGKPIDDKDEQVMLSFHNMTKFGNGVINFSQAWDKEKNLSPQQKLNLPCGRKFLQVPVFAIFTVFLAICKHKFPRIKITANFFSRKNLLQSKFSLTYIGYTKIQY